MESDNLTNIFRTLVNAVIAYLALEVFLMLLVVGVIVWAFKKRMRE